MLSTPPPSSMCAGGMKGDVWHEQSSGRKEPAQVQAGALSSMPKPSKEKRAMATEEDKAVERRFIEEMWTSTILAPWTSATPPRWSSTIPPFLGRVPGG